MASGGCCLTWPFTALSNPALAADKKVRTMFMASLRSSDQLTRLATLVDETLAAE